MNVLLAIIGWLLLGAPTAVFFWRSGRLRLAVAVVPLAGLLAITGGPILAGWLALPMDRWVLLSALTSLFLAALVGVLMNRVSHDHGEQPALNSPLGSLASVIALLLVGISNLITGGRLARGWPGFEWDGFSIWLLRGRVLAGSEAFPSSLFGEAQLAGGHWDYPILLPSFFAWFMKIGGLETHELSICIGLLMAVIPVAITLGLSRSMPLPFATIAGLSPLLVPGLVRVHYAAYADPMIVMLMVGAMGWLIMGAACRDRGQLVAGGLALAALVATKNEGMLWALALLAMTFLMSFGQVDMVDLGKRLFRVAVLPGVFFVLWTVLSRRLGADNDLMGSLNLEALPDRMHTVYVAICQEIIALETLLILLFSVGVIVLFTYGSLAARFRSTLVFLSAPIIYCIGMAFIYAGTPHDLNWHLDTSLTRTLSGVLPAIVTAAVCCYARDLQPASRQKNIASLSNALY